MTKKIITESLGAVNRRNRMQRLFESLCCGIFYAAVVALIVIIAQFPGWLPQWNGWGVLGICLIFGLLLGGIVGWILPSDAKNSAEKIDTHYRLKDRILTALRLIAKPSQTPIERLQISDAAMYAAKVDAKSVVPYRLPRNFGQTVLLLFATAILCAVSPIINPRQVAEAAPLPVQAVVESTEILKKELVEWVKEKAEEHKDEKELQKLAEKLEQSQMKLEDAVANPREAMAVMSEMEATMNQTMSDYNLEQMDASMQEIADALSAAEASRSTSQHLKEKNYAKAAEDLKKMDSSQMSKQERNAVSSQLKKATAGMQKRGQDKLLKLIDKLAEELQEGNCDGAKESACDIAGICKSQGLRKGICQSLGSKLALLGLCKSDCAGSCNGSCSNPSDKNGSNNTSKSNNPSKNWGRGTAGQPDTGKETNLDGNREMKQITGIQGNGPSEFEKITSKEGNEEMSRIPYKDVYKESKKISESVLENEPIPLGQRRMIRQYFESIRPQGDENEELK
ncbi:MAG: hypothetical protein LBJ67_03890 [Planctomycetaceae bacterium]|jgi:soluble cytochrome b562|nr:hypothetical protein [Planctomycetaceae bacterium]